MEFAEIYNWCVSALFGCSIRIFNIGISASFFALAVIAFRAIFKKAPKWLVVALWALVAIRLICPFSIESSMSLIPSAETLPYEEVFDSDADSSDTVSFDLVKNPLYSEFAGDGAQASLSGFDTMAIPFGIYIWFFGVFAMLLYALVSYIRLRHTVRTAIPLKDNVWLCDSVKSPFILGVFRPRIYLPSDMDVQTAELVLRHERAHLKRRDHLWKPLGFVLLSIYWFNPVLWLSYILLCRDIELACDEKVIKGMENADKKAYSEALLSCSVPHRMIAACPVAFGEVGVKKRIKSVLNYKKPAFWVILIALIVSIVIALCFMTDPKSENGGTVNYDGVDEISELSFDMDKILPSAYAYTVYNGNSTTDDYFEAKKEYVFCFSEVSSFLNELSLSRIVDGVVNPMHEPQTNGVIKISYDDYWSVRIIFHDDFSKMYMQRSSHDYSLRSKDYTVEDPSEAKKFFKEKPYMQNSLVWEYNLASSAMGHGEINFFVDEKYQISGEVKGDGTVGRYTDEEHKLDGIYWSPLFTDAPDEYNIHIPVTAEGEQKVFNITVSAVGKRGLATYFALRADDLVIGALPEGYKFVLSEAEDTKNLQWYYNPSLSAKGYGQLTFMLPDGYTVASREVNLSGKSDIYDYNSDADITEFKWSPDYGNIMKTGSVEMKVTAVKDNETVNYKFTLTPIMQDDKGGTYFEIKPDGCKITQRSWATYLLEGNNSSNETVDFYNLDTGSFDTTLISKLFMNGKATIKNGGKTAVVYYCNNILSALDGLWEFESGYYSHPSGEDLADMKMYSIETEDNEDVVYSVNFDKNCTLMWLANNYGGYTSTFKVKKPKVVKSFFENEEFFDKDFIWEYNPTANTYGYSHLIIWFDGEYISYTASFATKSLRKADIADDEIGGIVQSDPVKNITCTKDDNLIWQPSDSTEPIHFKMEMANGVVNEFDVYITESGTNYAGNTIYSIGGEDLKIYTINQGKIIVIYEPSHDISWLYNPDKSEGTDWFSATAYYLPESYEIKSAEATSGTTTVVDRYYNNPDNLKDVCWSPDENSKEDAELTIIAIKDGKEVKFRVNISCVGVDYDAGIKEYIINPVNCKIKETKTATFYLEEK